MTMSHMPLNEKYMKLCTRLGVPVRIQSTSFPEVPRYRISEEDGTLLLVQSDAPVHLGYEKFLAWGVRDVLLPRLALETPRLLIRRFVEADRPHCFPLLSHTEDCFMDCCRSFASMEEEFHQRVDLFLHRETQYAISLKDTGELIGTIHVFP